MKVVFMGTPGFSVPALRALIDGPHDVIAVYSQPPRPKGRGQQVQPSPVHETAAAANIPVVTPKSLRRDDAAQAQFIALDADVAVVAAYGLLLPPGVLAAPRHGCLNIHASLLPRWRGASPIQHAIWKGDAATGISIMQMDEGLDTGAVVAMREIPITTESTAPSLHDELAALGATMITETLARLSTDGRLDAKPQPETGVTYAPLLTKEDGRVNWSQSAHEIDRQIRALNPWPGVWAQTAAGNRFKILAAERTDEIFSASPGTLTDAAGCVSCGVG
ncbi:MAG TPA: methionyl-tRNA formyltransferase, partial [Alphaproteobacteria bacterium]